MKLYVYMEIFVLSASFRSKLPPRVSPVQIIGEFSVLLEVFLQRMLDIFRGKCIASPMNEILKPINFQNLLLGAPPSYDKTRTLSRKSSRKFSSSEEGAGSGETKRPSDERQSVRARRREGGKERCVQSMRSS